MFTGLIQEIGRIQKIQVCAHTIQLTCEASKEFLQDYKIGDSMAINGACLTAIDKKETTFTVDIMPETFKRTSFSKLKSGDKVNLELAMSSQGRFEGHFVSGHIDTTSKLIKKTKNENATLLTFYYPPALQAEIIPQGSIGINGVSLTVTAVTPGTFSIGLIPHSQQKTTLHDLTPGEIVNIETDIIGKYIKAQGGLSHEQNR
ncbi:riboflavin synthase [Aequitasia blattaphilus]|uniref:Riboflavin synthase n=1 Tax=Aequitasia blattaphilus TaxID=2949332 RepID=A0ABT1E556_9FIRM|nr:riboflavin synthase [Aequitasia blattaphilus]MCP1100965.1 riboflavin synthase [Aequitasia blattaphilus]MCR8613605.1 riboflavin synthase [Aequitasia blattaphilus]